MLSTVIAVAAAAGALVQAAPIAERGQPSTYYTPYLEPYDTYHLRYLALDCQDKHNTTFFSECCRPMLGEQKLSSRPDYCTPNATGIASASAYIASTSVSGVPTGTAAAAAATDAGETAAATTTSSADSEETSIYSAYSQAQETTTSSTTAAAAPTTQAAIAAQPTTTSTTEQAAATTQASSNNGGGNAQTGGYATYFYQGGNAGACGTVHSDSDPIIAIDQAWWGGSFGQQSSYCGKWITVKNNNNGKTVNAMVADVCPTCANGNSLDLSVGAFTAIASEADGMVPITWWFS